MKIDYKQFFELNYWFSPNPGFLSDPIAIGFGVFFSLCMIQGFALVRQIKSPSLDAPRKSVVRKIRTLLVTMGMIGYVLLFFSYQAVPFLSMRFLFLVWGLGAVLWAYLIWHFAVTRVPAMRDALEKREQMAKYTLHKRPA
jgi:hypothetical protein